MTAQSKPLSDAPKRLSVHAPLGYPPSETQAALQQEVYKELVNKFAWVLGSTYRRNYSNRRSVARVAAQYLVGLTIREHGFPESILKPAE